MRSVTVLAVALGALAVAKLAREGAKAEIGAVESVDEPFTPSSSSAPFLSLGYRELAADLFYVRLRGYYGGYYDTTADGIATLAEAIATLDPHLEKIYTFGANAMTLAPTGVDQKTFLRAIALLERGMAIMPERYDLPLLAGQIYFQDLKTDDPVQRRVWDEKAVSLIESAIRKPHAPLGINAEWAASMRTRLGQRERAVQSLRELLLVATNPGVRAKLLEKMATLTNEDSTEIAAEVFDMRARFEREWRETRPAVYRTMYVLIGKPLGTRFDLGDLAVGGDLIDPAKFERLEPLVEPTLKP